MDIPQYPVVIPLPPSSAVRTDHHGPKKRKTQVSLLDETPSYFLNPWKSYRVASLSDAWLAYQRGAAIAPAQSKSAGPYRSLSRPSPYHGEGEVEEEEEPLVEPEPSAKAKSRLYIRPEFSIWHEEDLEDDWRDLPIQVVSPRWDEAQLDKPSVTWLGHAGVLVQIPWKGRGKGREGMCGIVFDPIFSYRSVERPSVAKRCWQTPRPVR